MGILSSIGKGIAKVLDTTTVAIAHPVKTLTAIVSPKTTVNDLITEHFSQPLSKQITQTVYGTVGIAATVATAGASGLLGKAAAASKPAQIAATAVKSLIPTTKKGALTAAVVAPIAISAAVSNPKAVVEAPSKVLNFQTNVGELLANPSLEKAKETFKDNPLISTAVLGAGAVAVGAGVGGVVASVMNTQAIKEQTKTIKENNTPIVLPLPTSPNTSGVNVTEIKPAQPATIAQTKTISATTPKTRKKAPRTKKGYQGNVIQRVNVIVSNKSSSTGIRGARYLNERVFN